MKLNDLKNISEKLLINSNGLIKDNCHYFSQRIYYEDTDAGSVVYHANYLKFFERARTCLLNLLNIDQKELLKNFGLRFIVRDFSVRIKKPFSLNEIILVETRHKYAKNSYILLEQKALNLDEDYKKRQIYVKSDFQIVMIDKNNKVKNIKSFLVNTFFKN